MEKITLVEKAIIKARIEKNDLAKNLLQTLKGEYENATKSGEKSSDALFDKLAKKMVKNAELVGTEDAKKEITILKEYLPAELSEDQLKSVIVSVMENAPDKVNNFKLGNKGVIGWFMGAIMKETNNSADPKLTGKLLQELLQK